MKIVIDLDEVLKEAVKHMEDEGDLRFSVGMAMQELYWYKWEDLQNRMVEQYLEQAKANTYS